MIIKADHYYKQNLKRLLAEGCWDKDPRPKWQDGAPAHSLFITGVSESYDISKGEFPITTLRNTAWRTALHEMKWIYLDGSNDLLEARKMGIHWWDGFDIGDGTIGQRYGATVEKYDLFNRLLRDLKDDPFSRRHIMDLYQYSDLRESEGLHPCAYNTMWSVREIDDVKYLDVTLIQRSNDYLVAGYINKLQYTGLLLYVCSRVGMRPGIFNHFVQNLHIYDRHLDLAREVLEKEPLNQQPALVLEDPEQFKFNLVNTEGITKLSAVLDLAI